MMTYTQDFGLELESSEIDHFQVFLISYFSFLSKGMKGDKRYQKPLKIIDFRGFQFHARILCRYEHPPFIWPKTRNHLYG